MKASKFKANACRAFGKILMKFPPQNELEERNFGEQFNAINEVRENSNQHDNQLFRWTDAEDSVWVLTNQQQVSEKNKFDRSH